MSIHAEDEAKALMCPFKKTLDNTGESGKCEASGCMAWRWVVSSQDETHYLGYCGLAGRPFD